MSTGNRFPEVSLLITHFNRSASLKRLLASYKDLGCEFGEIVVSDDCSNAEHLNKVKLLQKEFGFKLVTTPVNKGLGNNINKGQDAGTKEYTLYVQEDFVPLLPFLAHFSDALQLLKANTEIDVARFYGYFHHPLRKAFERGYDKIQFKFWYPGYMKFNCYSDHPHLRKSTFFNKFGRYKEGVNGDITEYNMMLSFIKNGGIAFVFNQLNLMFEQLNNAVEPSTATFRKDWRLSQGFFVRMLRMFYLQFKVLKYNKDLINYPRIK